MNVAVFDIETSAIPDLIKDIKELFCIAIKLNDEPTKCYTYSMRDYADGTIYQAYEILKKADVIVGHNICKFDIPMIGKFLGKLDNEIVDTLIDAKLCYSKDLLNEIDLAIKDFPRSLIGSYSLKAFGYRFGLNKIEYDDFSNLCEDMVIYCKRDVDLTYELYKHLINLENYPSKLIRETEYKVASIIYEQEQYGFYFDIDKAYDVATSLKFKAMNNERKLKKLFSPILVADGDIVYPKMNRNSKLFIDIPWDKFRNIRPYIPPPKTRNGNIKLLRRYKTTPYNLVISSVAKDCPYQKIKLQSFNPNSRQQIIDRLKDKFDFIPTDFTPKGNPQLSEDTLDRAIKELEC